MKRVVVDASAMAAVVFQEPGFETVAARFDGAALFAPDLLKIELANVALIKARRNPAEAPGIFAALETAIDRRTGISWRDVDTVDVTLLAFMTGLTAYDAAYLWLAGWLEADLVTLDAQLIAASRVTA